MRRRSQSYWLMGSAMLGEIQTVTDKTRDAAVSARPSRVTRAVEMTTLRFIGPDTSHCGRPRCRQPPSQPRPVAQIAEDVQLAEGVHVPRTAWSILWTWRLRPLRIAGADQIGDVEALLATNGPDISRGA
jgi:hypothetical protein